MPGKACNGSRAIMLANALKKTVALDLTLRLYKNNLTPADSDNVDASAFTEATFTGYAGIAITALSWSITTAAPSVASYAQQTFTSSANQTPELVYGYYATRSDGSLAFAERFSDGPYSVSVNGQTVKVTPTLSLAD